MRITLDSGTEKEVSGETCSTLTVEHKGTTYDIREIRGKLEFRELD